MKSSTLSTWRGPATDSHRRWAATRQGRLLLALLLGGTWPVVAQDTPVLFEQLRSFGFPENSASQPMTWLVEARNGALYGIAGGGLYRVNKDGSGFSVLYPIGTSGLLEGSDGKLYGGGMGGILKIEPDGSGWQELYHFPNLAGLPHEAGPFIEASDGKLYATASGGDLEAGCLLRVNKDGTGLTVLYSFGADALTGGPTSPGGRLLEASDGWLYGTTFYGGSFNRGTIYRVRKDGTGFIQLLDFGAENSGVYPLGGLSEASDGFLYGATKFGGGQTSEGTVYRIDKSGTGSGYAVLHRFDIYQPSDGGRPEGLTLGRDGVLYGTCGVAGSNSSFGTVFRLNRDGTGFSVLHTFAHSPTNCGWPVGGVIEGTDGRLYGGCATGGGAGWDGAIYRLAPSGGQFDLVHSFSATGGDGQYPSSPLLEGPDGSQYGTTFAGGTNGGGTLFKYQPSTGRYTILHHLGGSSGNPTYPGGSLARDSQNRLFGIAGGVSAFYSPQGAIYRAGADGTGLAVLHRFQGPPSDGEIHDSAGLMLASDNRLYGTTFFGGTQWVGTVFRIDADGSNYMILRHFTRDTNSAMYPNGQLLEGSDGALYGGTIGYGSYSNHSCIFKLNKDGSSFRILHVFGDVPNDGQIVNAYLTEGRDGFLYGATREGGVLNRGTVFQLRKDGSDYSIVSDDLPGTKPVGGVVEGSDGALYGIMWAGPRDEDDDAVGPCIYRLSKTGGPAEALYGLSPYAFSYSVDGSRLLAASDGSLYGTTTEAGYSAGFGTIYRVTVPSLTRVSLARGGEGQVELRWRSVCGVTYRVQYKSRLEETSWMDLPGDVTGMGGLELKSDLPGTVNRFYRLMIVQ